jgi:hypothetical protein
MIHGIVEPFNKIQDHGLMKVFSMNQLDDRDETTIF